MFMKHVKEIKEKFSFYKEREKDKIWWVDFPDMDGFFAISFDKKKILFLFGDCPKNFSPEELEIFKKEQPFWANFFHLK